MAKVKINGELFEFDREYKPMVEMLALEKALDTTYGQWEDGMQNGSARALAGFIWLVWRRNGRDVPFEDIETGAVEVNYAEFEVIGEEVEAVDPTAASPAPREASATTGTSTSARSRKS